MEVGFDVVGLDDGPSLGSLDTLGSTLGVPDGSFETLGADDTIGSMLFARVGSLLTLGLDDGLELGCDVVGLDDGVEVGFDEVGFDVVG